MNKRELEEEAFRSAMQTLDADLDQELWKKLIETNEFATILQRLPPEQRNTIIIFTTRIHAKGGHGQLATWASGFLYGFQVAHDYVQQNGVLLEEGPRYESHTSTPDEPMG